MTHRIPLSLTAEQAGKLLPRFENRFPCAELELELAKLLKRDIDPFVGCQTPKTIPKSLRNRAFFSGIPSTPFVLGVSGKLVVH